LVVGTHGRGFWILDDITPLRQLKTLSGNNRLFIPQLATRIRWGNYTDTPYPQEEPSGENPPDGAIINYYVANDAKDISLEIFDAKGSKVISFSNKDTMYKLPALNIPTYWIRPQQILSGKTGAHRFVWDMHYAPLNLPPAYPIGAVYENTAPDPTSPWVMPGNYKIVLTIDGKMHEAPLKIRMDPRVKTSLLDLEKQWSISMLCYQGRITCQSALENIKNESNEIVREKKSAAIRKLENSCRSLFQVIQDSDWPPTSSMVLKAKEIEVELKALL
jgi:hypothetical protein